MEPKTVEVHFVVSVPIQILLDDHGNPAYVEKAGNPIIDSEPYSGIDSYGNEGNVWDPDLEIWRPTTDTEWTVAANVVTSDDTQALDEITRLLHEPEDDDMNLIGKICRIIDRTGRGGAF